MFWPETEQLKFLSMSEFNLPLHAYAAVKLNTVTAEGIIIESLPFYGIVCSGVKVKVYLRGALKAI